MTAIKSNYGDVVNQLLKHKPNLDFQDQDGNSYVHACVQTSDVSCLSRSFNLPAFALHVPFLHLSEIMATLGHDTNTRFCV